MARLIFLGGGGFAKEMAELAELCGHAVVGYVAPQVGSSGLSHWGDTPQLLQSRSNYDAACIAFGGVDRRSIARRAAAAEWLVQNGIPLQSLVAPTATICKGVTFGQGVFIGHRAVVSVDATIGDFAVLNLGCIVGHDTVIGTNASLAPAAFVAGTARVGRDTLIGPGAIVLQGLSIGERVIVGVGASVMRNVPDGATILPQHSRVL